MGGSGPVRPPQPVWRSASAVDLPMRSRVKVALECAELDQVGVRHRVDFGEQLAIAAAFIKSVLREGEETVEHGSISLKRVDGSNLPDRS